MIKAKIDINAEPIEELSAWVSQFNAVNAELGQSVARAIEPELLDELRTQPGKVKYPIAWTSEKQRRAFFATNGFGKGIPYKRRGKLAASWEVNTKARGGAFVLEVRNPAEAAQFVYGTLNQRSLTAAAKPQQQFHRNTGWQLAARTVNFWFDAAQEEYERQFADELAQFGTVTNVRRRSRRR